MRECNYGNRSMVKSVGIFAYWTLSKTFQLTQLKAGACCAEWKCKKLLARNTKRSNNRKS